MSSDFSTKFFQGQDYFWGQVFFPIIIGGFQDEHIQQVKGTI